MIKRIRIIAGPNGSGKTTLFRQLERKIPLYDFINADEIKLLLEKHGCFTLPFDVSQGEMVDSVASSSFDNSIKQFFIHDAIRCQGRTIRFSPESINSYSVAAFADFLRNAYLKRGISFTTETVFSHPSKLKLIRHAGRLGFRIYLYFVATDSPELNVARVEQRVVSGGHDVPREKIIERYFRCLDNFYGALHSAYRAYFWDNSTREMQFFAELKPDRSLEIVGGTPNWFRDYILKKIH